MALSIRAYGPLRQHMPQRFSFESDGIENGRMLLARLSELYPTAASLLKSCRVAAGDVILDPESALGKGEISLLPPSSGG